jgi:RNA polymerase sigma-70 factor (ECF subfamily)
MAADMDPDSVLMQQVRQGDREAFAQLVDKYKQPIFNFVARTLRDPDEAEDVAQTVFIQVFKAADRYEVNARFSTWLFTIARNACLNELRRRSRHPAESLEAGEEDTDRPTRQLADADSPSPPQALLHQELREKLAVALAELPENQRTAILMCQQTDLSYEEIARVLDCSLSATKSLIHRGRETLKLKLKPYLRTGEWQDGGKSE